MSRKSNYTYVVKLFDMANMYKDNFDSTIKSMCVRMFLNPKQNDTSEPIGPAVATKK